MTSASASDASRPLALRRKTVSATAEILQLPVLTRKCPRCQETKPRVEFYPAKEKKDGCSVYCKPCFNRLCGERYKKSRAKASSKYNKKKWANHSSRERTQAMVERFERHIFSKFGLSLGDLRDILRRQHNLCANRACGTEISLDVHGREPNRAVADHCHDTGKFRGLLCNKCNHAEGFYSQHKNRLIGIIEYLDKNGA